MRSSNSTVYRPVVLSKSVTRPVLFAKRLSLMILVPIQWGRFGKLYQLLVPPVVTVLEVFARRGERRRGTTGIGVSAFGEGSPSQFCVNRCKVIIAEL